MSMTRQEIDRFHDFALEKLGNGGADLSIDDIFDLWRLENPTPQAQQDIHAAIRRGLADVDAGRYERADKVMRELRVKHEIPCE